MIRGATAGDADALVDVIVSSGLFESEQAIDIRHMFSVDMEAQESVTRWTVVAAEDQVNAVAMYRPVEAADGVWDLTMIAVRAGHQARGIGGHLLDHIEQELLARGVRRLIIDTSSLPTFATARRFYLSRGYVKAGYVPDFWAVGDGRITFSKALMPPAASGRLPRASSLVRELDATELDRLKGLWLQLHQHYRQVVEGFSDLVRDDERSWTLRRAMYEAILREGRGFILGALGQSGDEMLGYTAVEIREGGDDTFEVGTASAEVVTLVVDERRRGSGCGTGLLDEVDSRLALRGVGAVSIAVMGDNHAAVDFYERRGLVPVEVTLWRSTAR